MAEAGTGKGWVFLWGEQLADAGRVLSDLKVRHPVPSFTAMRFSIETPCGLEPGCLGFRRITPIPRLKRAKRILSLVVISWEWTGGRKRGARLRERAAGGKVGRACARGDGKCVTLERGVRRDEPPVCHQAG
jgi:hypothetical protein